MKSNKKQGEFGWIIGFPKIKEDALIKFFGVYYQLQCKR